MATAILDQGNTPQDTVEVPRLIQKDEERQQLLDDAFVYLDAAMPTVLDTIEHLGNTDEARTFWLAQKALEEAHKLLSKARGWKS